MHKWWVNKWIQTMHEWIWMNQWNPMTFCDYLVSNVYSNLLL